MQFIFGKLVYHPIHLILAKVMALIALYMHIDWHEITWGELYGFDKPGCGGKAEAMECMLKGAPGGN